MCEIKNFDEKKKKKKDKIVHKRILQEIFPSLKCEERD